MKRGGKTVVLALGGVLLCTGAEAVSSGASSSAGAGSPYTGIVERNVFNLHDPPKPPDPADLIKKDPLPKLTLTGITTILGKKVTFLTIPATKPGGTPQSFMLAEGQAQEEIEVQQIDEKAGVVKVLNHGEAQTLDFEHDGVKTSGAAPPAAVQGSPAFPRPAAPPLNVMPSQGRPIRPFGGQPRNVPVTSPNASAIQNAIAPPTAASQSAAPLSAEEMTALIEIQRAKMLQEGDPTAKIMPPTDLTPETTGAAPQ